jgi:hypothetical protein
VHRNVRKAMETAKGMSGDVYLTLDAYLEVVVPQIARVRWAPRAGARRRRQRDGPDRLPTEMQHLVIKSTLDWVLEREERHVVVVPEAWKFIPQGRGTPVKLAAEAFIRQGAGAEELPCGSTARTSAASRRRSCGACRCGSSACSARRTRSSGRSTTSRPVAKPSKADIAPRARAVLRVLGEARDQDLRAAGVDERRAGARWPTARSTSRSPRSSVRRSDATPFGRRRIRMPQKPKRSATKTRVSRAKTPTYGDDSTRSRRQVDRVISDMRVLLTSIVISDALDALTARQKAGLRSLMGRATLLERPR